MTDRTESRSRSSAIATICALIFLMFSHAFALESGASSGPDWSGSIIYAFDYDENEREDDFDFSTYLRTRTGVTLRERKVSLVFNGRLRTDLDSGSSDRDRAFEARTDKRIFQAYLDTKDWWPWASGIRIGRQWVHEIESIHMDGIRFSTKSDKANFMVFGGRPVSEFSAVSSHHVYGGQMRLLVGGLDIPLHFLLNDEDRYVNDQAGIGFSRGLWNRQAHAYGDYTLLNGRGRELRAGISSFVSAFNMDVSARYYQRLTESGSDETADDRIFSEYFRILNTSRRLRQLDLTLTKYFSRFAVGGGLNVTAVDRDDSGNRKATHRYVNLHVFDFLANDLSLLLQANIARQQFDSQYAYNIQGSAGATDTRGRDETFSVSGQLDYRADRDTRVSAGVSWSDYDFSSSVNPNVIFTQEAMEAHGVLTNVPHLLTQDLGGDFIVKTYFLRLRKRFASGWEAQLRMSYDRGGLSRNIGNRGYKRVLLRLTRRF